MSTTSADNVCWDFKRNGDCSYGSRCKYTHVRKAEISQNPPAATKDALVGKKFRYEWEGNPTLKVVVGGKGSNFWVHKDVISEHSYFFKSACRGEWKEAQEQTVTLPDDKPVIFKIYMQWLYGREIVFAVEDPAVDSINRTDQEMVRLIEAWVFGHKYQDHGYTNDVMRALITHIQDGKTWVSSSKHITIIYNNTPAGCPLRTLFVEIYGSRLLAMHVEKYLKDKLLHEEFVYDLVHFLLGSRKADIVAATPLNVSKFLVKEDVPL